MTRRVTWFASFGIAVTAALLMRSLDADWLTTFSTAALTFVALPDMLARKRSPGRGIYSETIPDDWKVVQRAAGAGVEISARYP
jgi:hypothetical protein